MSGRNTTFWPKVGEMGVNKQEIHFCQEKYMATIDNLT